MPECRAGVFPAFRPGCSEEAALGRKKAAGRGAAGYWPPGLGLLLPGGPGAGPGPTETAKRPGPPPAAGARRRRTGPLLHPAAPARPAEGRRRRLGGSRATMTTPERVPARPAVVIATCDCRRGPAVSMATRSAPRLPPSGRSGRAGAGGSSWGLPLSGRPVGGRLLRRGRSGAGDACLRGRFWLRCFGPSWAFCGRLRGAAAPKSPCVAPSLYSSPAAWLPPRWAPSAQRDPQPHSASKRAHTPSPVCRRG